MQRLSGEDAGFLSMEQPEQPMNTIAVGLLTPGAGGPLTRDDVRRHLEARLDLLPSFRWRIVRVPLGLHQPVAVEDPDFDLDFHLRTATLPAPGGERELDACFAALAEKHLDRRHPLWQLTLVDGLSGGRQALVLKYHHCLADGVGALTTFTRVYSDQPVPAPAERWAPERLPRRTRLVADALRDHLRALPRLPRLALRTKRGVDAVKARRATASVTTPEFSGDAPWTALNDAFTVGRTYGRVSLPLDGVKQVKEAAGVTLNDVVLAVVAGGLRRYLSARAELPDRPLLATVPVSSEPPGAPTRQHGNRFWSFTTSLATDVDDPWARLHTISTVTAEARQQLELLGTDLMPAWLDVVPPFVADPGARGVLQRARDHRDSVDANVLVSNIRGPAEPWTLGTATVDELYIDGPPSNGMGANVMLWSYGDRLLFGILAFADAVHAPDELRAGLIEAYEELHALAIRRAP